MRTLNDEEQVEYKLLVKKAYEANNKFWRAKPAQFSTLERLLTDAENALDLFRQSHT